MSLYDRIYDYVYFPRGSSVVTKEPRGKYRFAEYPLFYRAVLQKRRIIIRSLQIVATPYVYFPRGSSVVHPNKSTTVESLPMLVISSLAMTKYRVAHPTRTPLPSFVLPAQKCKPYSKRIGFGGDFNRKDCRCREFGGWRGR